MTGLARQESELAWELRRWWAQFKPVVLVLSDRCDPRRAEGIITQVAVTDAFAIVRDREVGELHVPLADVLAVRRPDGQGGSRA